MRTKVTETVLKKIDEMTKAEQEQALEKWLADGWDMAGDDDWTASLKKFEEVTGINVRDWGILPRHYRVSCPSEIEDLPCTGIRLRTWILNHWDWMFTVRKHYAIPGKEVNMNPRRKWHNARLMTEEASCPFTGFCGDESLLDPLRDFIREGFRKDEDLWPEGRTTLKDLLDDCVDKWLKDFENDCESQQTLEYFVDHARANEYEFNEIGEIES